MAVNHIPASDPYKQHGRVDFQERYETVKLTCFLIYDADIRYIKHEWNSDPEYLAVSWFGPEVLSLWTLHVLSMSPQVFSGFTGLLPQSKALLG